jgi:hypothetical protein
MKAYNTRVAVAPQDRFVKYPNKYTASRTDDRGNRS